MAGKNNELINKWIGLTSFYDKVSKDLEQKLHEKHKVSLKEFYVLLLLFESSNRQLPLQELQLKVGLSQSAMSRLAARMESKDCGVIRRHGYGDDKRGVYTTINNDRQWGSFLS
ncbi:MarR family transcriptional regulator [Peribacillus frigoritolerans]|uniref:MarR family transcriptional regulator n=1 Tax=Peribacillus frigoritolerans TaxID=450367 RepID=UPI0035117670